MAGRTGSIHVRVKKGPQVLLEVEDEGPGIPADLKARLFEPYVTTKPQGTGLGLAIVGRVVDTHRGKVKIKSRPGQGTTVSVILPV